MPILMLVRPPHRTRRIFGLFRNVHQLRKYTLRIQQEVNAAAGHMSLSFQALRLAANNLQADARSKVCALISIRRNLILVRFRTHKNSLGEQVDNVRCG